jgi:hypothetical protein
MTSTRTFCASLIVVAGTLFVPKVAAQTNGFMRKVSLHEVEVDLQATLSMVLQGTSAAAARRIETIEKRTWQTFQALPKNAAGRLAPQAVRYIVHDYFAREHGWLINGLEPHGMQLNVTGMHDVNILVDKAPLVVEGLLEARQGDRGLSFNDIVAMAAVLEQIMFDESVTLLEAAYSFNGLSMQDQIDEAALHTILRSYLLLFGLGSKAKLEPTIENVQSHQALLRTQTAEQEFEHDTVFNYEFARRHTVNPFKPRLYSFDAVSEIMEVLAQQYGKWQNAECRDMKAHLKELDPDGLGHLPLGRFYEQPKGSTYHFSESADYLRKIGALDETSPSDPKVIITNYMAGPSNCIATSSYYSVCCLSECSEILAELEHLIAAPSASPEKLLSLIGTLSDETLPEGLPKKLESIAARHGGEVPLHGRLFAQWLHFAFPHECPYPSVVQSSAALTASEWLDGQSVASAQEREQHKALASVPSMGDLDLEGRWSDEEILPVHDRPTASSVWFGSGALRVVVQLVAIGVALRSALAAFQGSMACSDKAAKIKKDDDLVLGMRV